MKKNIRVLFSLLPFMVATHAIAITDISGSSLTDSSLEVLKTHNTISSVSLRLHLDNEMHGFVDSKLCSFCKNIRVIVTPETAAYENNKQVPLQHAKKRIGRHATVTYDLKTKNVSAIRW